MRVEKPNLNHIEHGQKAYKAQNAKSLEALKKNSNHDRQIEAGKKDTLEISSKAKELYSETVRQQKESAASIGNGLTKGELQNALKETQIARDPQQAEKIAEKVMNQVKQESKVRTDKIAVIQQRVESGFYNSPEVFEKIAEELMKEMKF